MNKQTHTAKNPARENSGKQGSGKEGGSKTGNHAQAGGDKDRGPQPDTVGSEEDVARSGGVILPHGEDESQLDEMRAENESPDKTADRNARVTKSHPGEKGRTLPDQDAKRHEARKHK